MHRSCTAHVGTSDLDFRVLHYSCHDYNSLASLTKGTHQKQWIVQCGSESPYNIKLQVEKQFMSGTKVTASCNNEKIYPPNGPSTKLTQDFQYTWRFRAVVKNIGKIDFYEVKAAYVQNEHSDAWLACTILSQKPNLMFEVCVRLLIPGSTDIYKEITVPAVQICDLRERQSQKPIACEQRILALTFPPENTFEKASLKFDGDPSVTEHFAKMPSSHSFNGGVQNNSITLNVAKDRKTVTSKIGAVELRNCLQGECFAIRVNPDGTKTCTWWEIQVGPSKRRVELEKKAKSSKVLTLSIDGQELVATTGQDLGCSGESWSVGFQLFSELSINFEVFQNNKDGVTLDTKAVETMKHKYNHKCRIQLMEMRDVRDAKLYVNDVEFMNLPQPSQHAEPELTVATQVLEAQEGQYKLRVPWSTNHAAAAGVQKLAERPMTGILAMFRCCTAPQKLGTDDHEMKAY